MLSLKYRILVISVLIAVLSGVTYAAPTQPISYQGRLTDNSGNPVANGTYKVTFTIYSSQKLGPTLWTEQHEVNTSDGMFTALLGSIVPFDATLFSEFPRYLGIAIDAEPEMSPRILMASVPYALNAPGGTGGYWLQSGSDIYYNGGNVGIGTTSPASALEVIGDLTVSKDWGPRLNLKAKYIGGERPRITFGGDPLAIFDGDATTGHIFSFMNTFGPVRNYDATLRIHGRTTNSWDTFLGLTHDGTRGTISTDVGSISLMPASGNVGIGTATPGAKLDVAGPVKIADGSQGVGKVLTSDANGLASWQTGSTGSQWTTAGSSIYYGGRVGVGTSLPTDSLEVNGGMTISKNDGPRLTFKDYAMGGERPRLSFIGDFITIFDGDAATEHVYSLMNNFSNVRNYDATVRIHGRAANSWNTYLSLTHDGTRGILSTDVGHISLTPATGFVGIGTITPNAPLGFPAALGKKITLYPGATGDVGFGVAGNRLQIYSDNPNADVALGYDAAGTFNERFAVKPNGALAVSGNTGAPGEVLTSEGSGAPAHWTPKSSSTFATYYNNNEETSPLLTPTNTSHVFSHTYPITVAANSRLVISANFDIASSWCLACPQSEDHFRVLVDGIEVKTFYYLVTGNGLTAAASISNFMHDIGPGTHLVTFDVIHFFMRSDSYATIYSSSIMVLPQ